MYRDDRDALQHQVEKLEQDLEEARQHGDAAVQHRAEELAAEAERMESQLVAMRREIAELRGPQKARLPRLAFVGLGVGLVIVGASAASWIVLARSASRAPEPVSVATEPVAPAATLKPEPAPEPAPEPVPTPAPEPAPEPAPATAAAPPPPDGHADITWTASVVRAKGLALAPRTKCLVTAEVRAHTRYDKGLHIHCGAVVVYDTNQPLEGLIVSESSDVRELPGPAPGTAVYTLRRTDSGPRRGERPELDLDSVAGKLVAWRGGVSDLRVELRMNAVSEPAPPLSLPEERLERAGKVEAVSAGAPVKVGAACTVRAVSNDRCVARLDCGGVALANGAVATCNGGASELARVRVDDDAASFVVEAGKPTVVTSRAKKPWELTIAWDARD